MKIIQVDLDRTIGAVKPLHGVGNGPLNFGSFDYQDVSDRYRELAVPHVRIHDQNGAYPREVDLPQIFRDETADPQDPASYDFERTDEYIQSIVDVGARITYRLGVSIELTKKKYFAHPPKDFARWAQVCIGIIKHYNQGWANGFRHGIRHWEIWNEPDLGPSMWSGTFEQYLELYATASRAIKAFDPSIKIGGCAAAFPRKTAPQFLDFCRAQKLPLDFFSWHRYTNDPGEIVDTARLVRTLLDEQGYHQAESHLNEWNLRSGMGHSHEQGPGWEYVRREGFDRFKNEVGASFVTAVLIGLQDAAVDVANYYDAQPPAMFCGLFDLYAIPQKTFYAFKAFRELVDCPERVPATLPSEAGPVSCLAAVDRSNRTAAVLFSKFRGEWVDNYGIELSGKMIQDGVIAEIHYLDKYRNLEPMRLPATASGQRMTFNMHLGEYAVVLVKIRGR